jgi:hypothetical protein
MSPPVRASGAARATDEIQFVCREIFAVKRALRSFNPGQSNWHCKDSQTLERFTTPVMAGLVPATHVFCFAAK